MEFNYTCLVYKQKETPSVPLFCIFHAPVGEILQWADIKRLDEEDRGPQRRTSTSKVRAISRFMSGDEANTIPTSIVLTLNIDPAMLAIGDTCSIIKILTVDNPEPQAGLQLDTIIKKPGLVIDGQHRLLGINEFNSSTHVNVVCLLNANDTETAFQFMVINNKASKVSTDHIRALSLQYEEDELSKRLSVARLTLHPNVGFVGLIDTDENSPFKGMISWPVDQSTSRIIVPSSIETALSYIQQQKIKQFDSEDILIDFFYAIWNTIKEKWSTIWEQQYKLLTKIGIVCMTEYMTDSLVASFDLGLIDISNPDDVKIKTEEFLNKQKREFWTVGWTSTSYDTRAGREMVKESLVRVSRNIRSENKWYEDVAIIDIAGLE